jgi:acyl-coenzyme A thioesterase PaaI-like protein
MGAVTRSFRSPDSHVIGELGLKVVPVGDEMVGTAQLQPELFVPGTTCVRTSVLALWADIVCGMLVALHTYPRVPVTLDLTLELITPPRDIDSLTVTARMVKAGRSTTVTEFVVEGPNGELLGQGGAAFMIAPDVSLVLPDNSETLERLAIRTPKLNAPFAERLNCELMSPGVTSMPHTHETGNAAGTLQGGLIALVAEEAALSLAPAGSTFISMGLRYLRPARVGPAVATAQQNGDVYRVEVCDGGSDDKLCVLMTGRHAPLIQQQHPLHAGTTKNR